MGAIMRVQGPVPVVASHPIFTFEQEVGLSTLIARGELLEALALTRCMTMASKAPQIYVVVISPRMAVCRRRMNR
jgi:hypothetical protein